jgi:hypothetical protein
VKKSLPIKLMISAITFAMLAAACGSGEESTDATDSGTSATTEETSESAEAPTEADEEEAAATPTVDTPAANLTRDLTYLLVEHEYLAGTAVLTAVQAGGDLEDATFQSAAKTLDDNSKALADGIASVYGPEGGEQFLDLWRAHIGFFVDYTLGKATDNAEMTKKASNDLDGYRADFGAFIEGATEGGLPADAVADALDPHVKSTKTAIDSVVAGNGKAFDDLRGAATHMPGIATALAGAIVDQFPDKF